MTKITGWLAALKRWWTRGPNMLSFDGSDGKTYLLVRNKVTGKYDLGVMHFNADYVNKTLRLTKIQIETGLREYLDQIDDGSSESEIR
jgi:hypothetical protein